LIPQLLFDIAYCDSFKQEFDDTKVCFKISHYQLKSNRSAEDIMIPEPWDGDIASAPILVVSSNPAYTPEELFPTKDWPRNMVADYFTNRFKNRGKLYSWTYNHKILLKDGSRGHSVRYWSSIQKRVEELLGRPAVPGQDYCMAEIVHCKTNQEYGVKESVDFCARKFLMRKIEVSNARLILGIGSHVKSYLNEVDTLSSVPVVYLPHPSSFETKTFHGKYSQEQIARFRSYLDSGTSTRDNQQTLNIMMPSDDEVIDFIKSRLR